VFFIFSIDLSLYSLYNLSKFNIFVSIISFTIFVTNSFCHIFPLCISKYFDFIFFCSGIFSLKWTLSIIDNNGSKPSPYNISYLSSFDNILISSFRYSIIFIILFCILFCVCIIGFFFLFSFICFSNSCIFSFLLFHYYSL